jgi:hypothetical protein
MLSRILHLNSSDGDVINQNISFASFSVWIGCLKTTLHKCNNNSGYIRVFVKSVPVTDRAPKLKSKGKFTFRYLRFLVFTSVCQLVK